MVAHLAHLRERGGQGHCELRRSLGLPNELATELLEGMEAKGLVKRSKIRGGKRWVVA